MGQVLSCVYRFSKGETDFNANGIADRDELIEFVLKRVEVLIDEKVTAIKNGKNVII
tara:strand:+ start:55 stop:225 length:171 start_codon:yes stop_codon:yes gene_type:complete